MFELHTILKNDTILIRDLKLCQLLLMNNSFYPWLILVPKKPNLIEIIDLKKSDQILLMSEIDLISKVIKKIFNPDKINIATFGNIVSQLHIHIIARYKSDRVFPKPVWLDNETKIYDQKESDKIIAKIIKVLL